MSLTKHKPDQKNPTGQAHPPHDGHGHTRGQAPSLSAAPGAKAGWAPRGEHAEPCWCWAGTHNPKHKVKRLTKKKRKKFKQQLSEIIEMSFRSEASHTATGKALAPSANPSRHGYRLGVIYPSCTEPTKCHLRNTGTDSSSELVFSINCSCLDMKYSSQLLLEFILAKCYDKENDLDLHLHDF